MVFILTSEEKSHALLFLPRTALASGVHAESMTCVENNNACDFSVF